MITFFFILFGLFVGSFLNVLIDRLPREETVLSGRSHCEFCKHKLDWYDLIPLVSFVLLKGKCRYCRTPLSFYYPIVEMTTGFLFVLSYVFLPLTFIYYYLFLISTLIVIFFIDLKYGIIPDKILFPAIFVSLPYLFIIHYSLLIIHIASALGAFVFFFLLHLLTRGRGMGFGDVKFVILMGLVLGFPGIVIGLYIAFLTGAIISLILVAWGKKKLRGSTVPFGPFLVFGMLVSLFWGNVILGFLQNLLLR